MMRSFRRCAEPFSVHLRILGVYVGDADADHCSSAVLVNCGNLHQHPEHIWRREPTVGAAAEPPAISFMTWCLFVAFNPLRAVPLSCTLAGPSKEVEVSMTGLESNMRAWQKQIFWVAPGGSGNCFQTEVLPARSTSTSQCLCLCRFFAQTLHVECVGPSRRPPALTGLNWGWYSII